MKVLAKINGGWYVGDYNGYGGRVNLPTKLQYQAEELYVEDNGEFRCLKNRYDRETPMDKDEALFTILKASPLNMSTFTIPGWAKGYAE